MAAQPKKYSSWQFYLLQLPFWSALVLLVMTTFLVLAIRFLVPQVDHLRPHLETWLEQRLPFKVEISHLSGSLFKIDPAIGIEKLTLSKDGQNFLVIEDVYFELDTLSTLIAGTPRMKDARLAGLELWLEESLQGWQLKGWQKTTKIDKTTKKNGAEDSLRQVVGYLEQLLVQGELNFSDLRFNLAPLDDEAIFFSADSMSYRRWLQGRQFAFELASSTDATQPAELVVTLEGDSFNYQTSSLTAWFNLPLVTLTDFQSLWLSSAKEETQNMQGQLSVEGWLSLKQGQTKLDLQARNIELRRDDLWQIDFATADLTLEGNLETWSADWKISKLNASEYYFNELAGRIGKNSQQSYLQLEELNLETLAQHIKEDTHLPKGVRELIEDLAPGGSLKNLLITGNSLDDFELQANLYDVKVAAWEGAPLGSGLRGWLQADAKGGQVIFADHSLGLGFPRLYSPVWAFSNAKGAVRWELDGEDLWVIGEDLAVVLPIDELPANNVYVSGDFAYFYGPSDQRFYLNLGLLPAKAAAHHQLVPDKLVDPLLLDWLNSALLAGQVNQAGFIYAGSIQNNATFQLVTDFTATDFKFQPDWPHLSKASGQVQVLDGWVKGQVKSAKLGVGSLSNAKFSTSASSQDLVALNVVTEIQTALEFFPWLVINSPLKTQVPEPLHEWLYSGHLKGKINLNIPLTETDLEPSIQLTSQISAAQLTLSQVDLTINDINGPLNFTLDQGLESQGLMGKVMSQPVTAVFENHPESFLKFSAGLAAKDLKKRFNLPETLNFTGVTEIKGKLSLAPFDVLEVTSDFKGLALNTPLPWSKSATEERAFYMGLDFSTDELPLNIQLADQLDFLMHINQLHRGSHLQIAEQTVVKAILPEQPGLAISLNLEQLNAEPLYKWAKQIFNMQASSKNTDINTATDKLQDLSKVNINIGDLSWDDFELGKFDFTLQNLEDAFKINYAATLSAGDVWWPKNLDQQPEITLSHLYIPKAEADNDSNKKAPKRTERVTVDDWLADYNPQEIPVASIKINDLRLGKKKLGKLSVQTTQQEKGIKLDPLLVDLEQTSIIAHLDWLVTAEGPITHLEGRLMGKNIAPALKALTAEKESPIISGQHQLLFNTDWQGSPVAFDLQTVTGQFELELKDGYFPKTDLALSGISQIFGLLNMDTLLRRLRLDFSDLKAKGISYNSIKGKYQLNNGYLTTNEPTKVVSSATRMTLAGEVDLIEETLQQELVIVLPVAQSLPLAAVVVGAPQVGAAIWVVQKIFSNLFDTFTEARYKVSGSINDPKVELQRVF